MYVIYSLSTINSISFYNKYHITILQFHNVYFVTLSSALKFELNWTDDILTKPLKYSNNMNLKQNVVLSEYSLFKIIDAKVCLHLFLCLPVYIKHKHTRTLILFN